VKRREKLLNLTEIVINDKEKTSGEKGILPVKIQMFRQKTCQFNGFHPMKYFLCRSYDPNDLNSFLIQVLLKKNNICNTDYATYLIHSYTDAFLT